MEMSTHLNTEYDGKQVGKASKCRSGDGHDNGNGGGLVSSSGFLTHMGTCIKACDGELGHQHSDQKDVPAKAEETCQCAVKHMHQSLQAS